MLERKQTILLGMVPIALWGVTVFTQLFAAEAPLFQDPVIPIGIEPWASTQADFNDDGQVDFIAPGYGSRTVTVLLGRGDGEFDEMPVDLLFTLGLEVGDFDGDGDTDFVTCQGGEDFQVLLGNGDGTFGPPVSFPVGDEYAQVATISAGDWNEDGDLDLVVGSMSGGQYWLVFGNGDGTFDSATDFGGGAGVAPSAVGDFDGNNHLDIAKTSNIIGVDLQVYSGFGNGNFGLAFSLDLDGVPVSLLAHDLDGDGRDDLIAITDLLWVRWSSNGVLRSYALGVGPWDVEAADLDGDAFVDLVVGDRSSQFVSVFFGIAGQRFAPALNVPTTNSNGQVEIADFDEDGNYDLGLAGTFQDNFFLLFGRGDGTFTPAPGRRDFDTGLDPGFPVLADFNEDRFLDAVVNNASSDDITVLLSDGLGGYTGTTTFSMGDEPLSIASGLIDADGHFDVATVNMVSQDVTVLLGVGDGTFGNPIPTALAPFPRALTLGDFNDDGASDIAAAHGDPLNQYTVQLGNNSGGFGAELAGNVGADPSYIAAGRLNDDQLEDLIVANGGSGDLSLMLATGPATFETERRISVGGQPIFVAIADVDRDNRQDLVVSRTGPAQVVILLGQNDGTFTEVSRIESGIGASAVAVDDLDGDGRLDLAGTTFRDAVTVFRGKGDGTFIEMGSSATYGRGAAVVAGPMDGDGRSDLVLTTGRDKLSVLLNIGPTSFSFAGDKVTLGWPPARDALGYNVYRGAISLLVDGDGDGLPDAGYGACQTVTGLDAEANQFIDATLPDARDGFFYLRSVAAQDGESGLGSTSNGLPRVPAETCP